MKKLVPFTLLALAALFAGCNGDNKTSKPTELGSVNMALSTTGDGTGYCITSALVITSTTNSALTYTLPADAACTETSINVPLLPGTYELTAPGITCDPPNDPDAPAYVSCTFDGTTPPTFTVTAGGEIEVDVNVTFNYLDQEVPVVFGVGEVAISMGTTTVAADLCGTIGGAGNELCDTATETCYVVDSTTAAPACYLNCSDTVPCPTDETCVLVLDTADIGVPIAPDSPPRVCMTL